MLSKCTHDQTFLSHNHVCTVYFQFISSRWLVGTHLRKEKPEEASFVPSSSWPFDKQCCRAISDPAEARPAMATPIKVAPLLMLSAQRDRMFII